MDNQTDAIQQLIQESETFLLATQQKAHPAFMLAREALRYTLAQNSKKTITTPALSDIDKNRWSDFLHPATETLPPKLVIALPKEKPKEITYHEKDNEMMFIITPKESFRKEDITIREMPPEVSAAFFFFPHDDPMHERVQKIATLPARDKMVFFIENGKTIAEKIYAITHALPMEDSRAKKAWATLLYASLLYETNHFREKISPPIFKIAESLLLRGVETQSHFIKEIETAHADPETVSLPFIHITGRALARTHIDESTRSSWTFLTQKDFQKSGIAGSAKESVIEKIITRIETMLPAVHASCFVWEGNPHIHCAIKSGNINLIKEFTAEESFSCTETLCRGGNFNSFTSAELRMRALLKEAMPPRESA